MKETKYNVKEWTVVRIRKTTLDKINAKRIKLATKKPPYMSQSQFIDYLVDSVA
jgi:hypothetical protein